MLNPKNNYSNWTKNEFLEFLETDIPTSAKIAYTMLNKDDIVILDETNTLYIYNEGVYIPYTDARLKSRIHLIISGYSEKTTFSTSLLNQVKLYLAWNVVEYNNFDAIPEFVNCENGIVNLSLGVFHPYKEKHYLSFMQIPVKYEKDAQCPKIYKFLIDVFGQLRVNLMYQIISYTLFKSNKFHKSFILFGAASSGKTTFIELLRVFLGYKNTTDISIQDINKQFQMANLRGNLADIYDELPLKKIGYMNNFKQVVTNNTLTGEIKNVQGSKTWSNFCKLIFTCNHLPEVSIEKGDDFWRRILLIHCTEFFDNGTKDFDIGSKISTSKELSGLLNECITAFQELENNKHFPEEFDNINTVQGIWQININPLKLFLDERCSFVETKKEEASFFRAQVKAFRKEKNALPISMNMISRKLKDLCIEKKRQKDKKYYYIGIKINTTIIGDEMDILDAYFEEKEKVSKTEVLDTFGNKINFGGK